MDYDAYLASSSSGSGDEFGSSGEGGGEPNTDHSRAKHSRKVEKYRSLLVDGEEGDGDGVSGEEVMEISWEPGLREEVQGVVRRRQEEDETTWERYRRERGKEKRSKVKVGAAGCKSDTAECQCLQLYRVAMTTMLNRMVSMVIRQMVISGSMTRSSSGMLLRHPRERKPLGRRVLRKKRKRSRQRLVEPVPERAGQGECVLLHRASCSC